MLIVVIRVCKSRAEEGEKRIIERVVSVVSVEYEWGWLVIFNV